MSTAGPAHRVQSAVVEYGYPQGHLGHLSDEEEAAFKNFKVLCEEKGYYKPGEGGTHDDATLLRFLRARRFAVADAFKQFQDTEDWRKANQLDTLYETIDLEQYEETRRLYPQWTGRRDRRGIPVYVYEVRHLNSKTMSAYEKSAKETHSKATPDGKTPPKLLRLFALYENLIRFVMPLCTALTDREHPRTPITQSNNIVDISGVGLKQFWNLRGHMQDASTLATAHYPETLDRIFIIGAPSFFPTVWGWIKKWFDPITTSKIFILSAADTKKTLESFIDPANIPVKYGGQLEFTFGDMPVFDPAIEKVIKWSSESDTQIEGTSKKDFPHGPMYWLSTSGTRLEGKLSSEDSETNEMRALAVGSIAGKQREQEICTVTRTLGKTEDLANGHATAPVEKREGDKEAEEAALQPMGLRVPTKEQLEAPTVPPTPALELDEPVPAYTENSNSGSNSNSNTLADSTPAPAPAPATATAQTSTLSPPSDSNSAEVPAASPLKEVQEGELVPATRPEPMRFVTANDGLSGLVKGVEGTELSEKSGNVEGVNGNGNGNGGVVGGDGPHATATANLLDPNVKV